MVVLPGGSNCLRILAIIFNLFVFHFTSLRPQEYGVVVVFLAIGFIICILGFLGCCGAWKKNVCMLTAFAFVIALLLILDLVLVVLGFVCKDKVCFTSSFS
ncbi:CD63 antigen, partial [Taenia solium]